MAAVAAAIPSTTRGLFPDYIRQLAQVDHVQSGTRASRTQSFVDGGEKMKRDESFLTRLHVRDDHWVLLYCTPKVIIVYDSLRSNTNGEAVEFAQILAGI